ncbi:hypothetical protein JW916_09175 [Candidatus Sumerlaeota bacterium]|nr:hypothetical protein [Candidatus Sumerlaeota bacterium]
MSKQLWSVARTHGRDLAIAALFWTLSVAPVAAFAPVDGGKKETEDLASRRRSAFMLTPSSAAEDQATAPQPSPMSGARTTAWKNFADRHGAEWRVEWNRTNGTAARLAGHRLATGLAHDASRESVEAWSRRFIDGQKTLLGVGSADLALDEFARTGKDARVAFVQRYKGMTVYGSRLRMRIDSRGDLVEVVSNVYPDVECNETARISPNEAARRVATTLVSHDRPAAKSRPARSPDRADRCVLKKSESVVFPMPAHASESYRLCYLQTIHTDDPLGDWVVVIDAARGVEYVRYNNYRFTNVSGTASGSILPMYAGETPQTRPLAGQTIHGLISASRPYSWDMSTNPSGWTTQGGWAWGYPSGAGGDWGDSGPTAGVTGSAVYGYNLSGGYNDDIASPMYLQTPALNCSGSVGTHLAFWQWLGVEAAVYDHVSLDVSNDGTNWTRVWNNLQNFARVASEWEWVVYDISAVADGQSTVYVRWGLGPTDDIVNLCGWYIDDVSIYGSGSTAAVDASGNYAVSRPESSDMLVWAALRGPYRDVYYEDAPRTLFYHTTGSGTLDIPWVPPTLSTVGFINLDSNPGWSTQGDWAYGTPLGAGGDPSSGYTGSNVYGYNLAGAYPNDMADARYLTTGAIDCSTLRGTRLRFWRWLGVEGYDWATIEVSSNGGSSWDDVWINPVYPDVVDTAWVQCTYDISSWVDGKSNVYIRWGMGPTDYSITYCGWNIDDIELLASTGASAIHPGLYDYDEVNVFHHMGVARSAIKNIDPSFTGMDYRVPAVVRIGTNYANAFSDGEGIYFGEGDGSSLGNTALYCDVIYHEFQHGVTHKIYPEPLLPYTGESGALDEAFSDYFACDITDEPLIGEGGLMITDPYMRNLDNDLAVPADWAGEVHDDGRIVGGAFWDLREAVGSSIASNLIHFARYQQPEDFFSFYLSVLRQDDDNANLFDGTPNMTAIAHAFGRHGIGGLRLDRVDQEVSNPIVKNGKIDAGETGNLNLRLQSYFLASNVAADFTATSSLATLSDANSQYGSFAYGEAKDNASDPATLSIGPACPEDEVIDVNVHLAAAGGYSADIPLVVINAPDQIVYDEGRVESYLGYGLYSGGFAVRFTPPFYPCDITGVRLFPYAAIPLTLKAWAGGGGGMPPGLESMSFDMTPTTSGQWMDVPLQVPTYAVVQEWNMDTNPGWSTQGQWAWGVPQGSGGQYGSPDPTCGATGNNVYGYNLAGDYGNSISSPYYLTAGAIDCSASAGTHLRFWRWLGVMSPYNDDASVQVSNNGSTWQTVWQNEDSLYEGRWTQVTYDISTVADGQPTVYVRWGMGTTDAVLTACGWNIDDVQILRLVSTSDRLTVHDGDVFFGWTEGYNTYYNGTTSRSPDNRTWVDDPELGWTPLSAYGYNVDMMVRVRYDTAYPTASSDWMLFE